MSEPRSESTVVPQVSIEQTMQRLGYGPSDALVQIFPLYHPDRQVFRVHEAAGPDVVVKVRDISDKARSEAAKITNLVGSYRFSGGHFPAVREVDFDGKIAITMPYLGPNLVELAQDIDSSTWNAAEPKPEQFLGFPPEQIEKLIEHLSHNHLNYARSFGLIHGDIIRAHQSPTNVVYNQSGSLFLVDGEGLAPFNDETEQRFMEDMDVLREWMYENLEKA
jgi:serine/threonine protein kinase